MELWDIQDNLKTALDTAAAGAVPVSLGFPDALEREHIWIGDNADGEPRYEITGTTPSEQTYELNVFGIVTFAGTYTETRARIETLWGFVTTAVATLVPSPTSQAEFGRWELRAGRNDDGHRQLAFTRTIKFTTG